MSTPSAPALREPDHDGVIVLEGATWDDFERMLEMRGDCGGPRFAYLEGRLEIMAPSRSHEGIKSMIGCLIEAWCFERDVDITPYGSWTLQNKKAQRGAEPDECYVLGADPDPEHPDLAIEVVWTSGRLDKLEIYRKLKVTEVWYWTRSSPPGVLQLFALRGEQYEPIDASEVLPDIDHLELLQYVDQRPMTKAVRAYRQALRKR